MHEVFAVMHEHQHGSLAGGKQVAWSGSGSLTLCSLLVRQFWTEQISNTDFWQL